MPTLLTRRAVFLYEQESSEGVDPLPTGAANAVLVEQPLRITFNPNIIDTTEVTPSLDPFDAIVGGTSATIECDVYLKGSGTAGVVPEWGQMLKCCGFTEAVSASATPAAPEAVVSAGPSPVQCTLGASALAGSPGYYRGMPINFTGTQTMSSFVWDYSTAKLARVTDTAGGNLTATTNYQIPANVSYTSGIGSVVVSTAEIPSGTIWIYNDGLLYKFNGCRGNVVFNITSGGPARASFRFMGMFASKTDAALPSATYQSTRPPIWKAGRLTIDSVAAAGGTMSIDMGNTLVMPDNPGAFEAFDPAIVTVRDSRGSFTPKETLVATRDIMGKFRSSTKAVLHAQLGSVVGNRVGITVPAALYLNQTPTDTNGYQVADVPFDIGNIENGFFITTY